MVSIERESEDISAPFIEIKCLKESSKCIYIHKTIQYVIDWVSEMFNLGGKKLHFLGMLASVVQDPA